MMGQSHSEAEKQRHGAGRLPPPGYGATRPLAEAVRLEALISSLQRELISIEESLASELELSSLRQSCHFARPVYVTTMQARQGNLKITIAMLSDRLARVSRSTAA